MAQKIEELRSKCQETFSLFDKDGNGSISSDELGKAMEKLGMQPTEDELKEIIQRLVIQIDLIPSNYHLVRCENLIHFKTIYFSTSIYGERFNM